MSQSDYNIGANPSGLNMRTEINQIFDSILTNNSGSTAPTVTKAFMMWVDTSNATYYYLKMRNHDNTAWVTLGIYTVATKAYTSYVEGTVKLTGNQTIDGVKTFSSSPIVPTPTTGDNSTNVASTAFVSNAISTGTVKLTGNQTIDGVKTFSSSPIVPTPTTGTQAVNKDYADLKVALTNFTGANQNLSGNGYQKLPGGLIIQWGTMPYTGDNANATITFPITFPNVCVSIVPSIDTVSNGAGNWSVYGKTTTNFSANYSSTVANSASGYYIAVGY